MDTSLKVDVGSGRIRRAGYVTLDKTQFVDLKGNKCVDVICDIEKEPLPWEDGSVKEIIVSDVLEHLHNLIYPMNEFHRVLAEDGHLVGHVPIANSNKHWKDPTHVRGFIRDTFSYFIGSNPAKPERPAHPKYADYGIQPWVACKIEEDVKDDLIHFDLVPRKL